MDGVLLYTCCLLSHPHSTVRFLMNDLPLYFALTFLTILSPGAGVLFTVTSALRSGFQDAWQAPLGNVLASACVAVACAAGIGAILTASPLITDSVRLKQVVNNLINNAKKFTVTGSITFGYVTNREGYTTIFVEDTGSGISEDAQKHIFERFYKEDSFTQGAGLGLSICQTIVDRLHGSISVSSELGKGTRFEVVIPDANE